MSKSVKELLKKNINSVLNFFGFELIKYYPEIKHKTFDEIYKELINNNETLIFDVGANQGQSISRFNRLFSRKKIHAFEPIQNEYNKISKKYYDDNSIKINNYSLGDKQEKKEFYVNEYSGSSSFHETNKNTDWFFYRSKQLNISEKNFTKEKKLVDVNTIDNYCKTNKIEFIDILKIDTQGYEENVLLGATNMIKNKKIKFIELEIIFSDIYNETLSIGNIENIIGKNYRIFANDNKGNLFSNFIYQLNLIYVEKDFYLKEIKK